MDPSPAEALRRDSEPGEAGTIALATEATGWRRLPLLPLALTLAFFAFVLFPPVRNNPRLTATFASVGAGLLVWQALLLVVAKRSGRSLLCAFVTPLKSHYIQASVQLCIYAYWGWYWPNVYAAAPLILAQIVFFYVFDALLSWSRGREWRIGLGPLPIIFSTNLFMWFKDDWFVFQFALVAACALGKEFIRWNRDGKSTHVFNPSAFGLALCSIVLIATGTTHYTWGVEVATTLGRPPHIYLLIFALGLVVQYYFAVTLMTFSAVAALCVLNLIYTGSTGLYHFVDTNIPIAVFLGLHLLVTDPSTSPRSNGGRVLFGALYGVANYVLFSLLGNLGVPDFYDKLLPVPILNLCVPAIDRLARMGWIGRFHRWESRFQPRKLNLVHMGSWAALFLTLLATGFVEAPHPGASIAFWKKAYDEGKPGAGRNLYKMVGALADSGFAPACRELGEMYLEGKVTARNEFAAAHYFARACELGNARGCADVARLFLSRGLAESEQVVARAFDRLEQDCGARGDGRNCFLVGLAYETGRGRPLDPQRALALYATGSGRGDSNASMGLVRLKLGGNSGAPVELGGAVRVIEQACAAGDAQSCLYLAYIYHGGHGVERDAARAQALMEQACRLDSQAACDDLSGPVHWAGLPAPVLSR